MGQECLRAYLDVIQIGFYSDGLLHGAPMPQWTKMSRLLRHVHACCPHVEVYVKPGLDPLVPTQIERRKGQILLDSLWQCKLYDGNIITSYEFCHMT